MLTREEIQYIAKLARIDVTKDQEEKLVKELSSILGYVEKLNEVDTTDIEPTAQVTGLENVFREDLAVVSSPEISERLIEATPGKEGHFVKVRSVFESRNK